MGSGCSLELKMPGAITSRNRCSRWMPGRVHQEFRSAQGMDARKGDRLAGKDADWFYWRMNCRLSWTIVGGAWVYQSPGDMNPIDCLTLGLVTGGDAKGLA